MHKLLIILMFGLLLTFPCSAQQQFIWLTDSSVHQNPQQYRQALDVNGATLKLLMQNVSAFEATTVQATTDRAMAMLKTETMACAGNRVKNAERLGFSYATTTPHTVFPGLRLYSKTTSATTRYLQSKLNSQKKISLLQLLQSTNELHFAIGGGRSYGDRLDQPLKQPKWQHKFWQRHSIDMSAGLIEMLLEDRVDLLIEYPNVMQHYLERVDVSGLFLQQSGRFLCKAARVQCSYST